MVSFFLYLRSNRFLKWIGYFLLKLVGVEIPVSVKIGKNFTLAHWGSGVVIHPKCKIGDNVKIYQGVTIGRSNISKKCPDNFEIILGGNSILCAGSKLLCRERTYIDEGIILGANSVLLASGQVPKGTYVGLPAKKVGCR